MHFRWKLAELPSLCGGKIALGDFFARKFSALLFYIDSQVAIYRKRVKREAVGMGQVESNRNIFRKRGFAISSGS